MIANKVVIALCVAILSLWIQAIPDGEETVEHRIESSLVEYLRHLPDQPSISEPMAAKNWTLEDSTLRSITSAEKDNVSVTVSTAPMTIEEYISLSKLPSLVVPLKTTQEKTAVTVLSPITIKILP